MVGADHVSVHPPHDYGLAVTLLNLADRDRAGRPGRARCRKGIDGFLLASSLAVTDPPQAIPIFEEMKKYQQTLPEPSRTYMQYVNDRAVDKLGPIVGAGRRRAVRHPGMPSLSPERATPPTAPVFLLHGVDDSVIPSVETVLLAEHLKGKARRRRAAERPDHPRRSQPHRHLDRSVATGAVLARHNEAVNVRLQKILSTAGIASRRASEQMILEGRVMVNGETIRELGAKADPAKDAIKVDGRRIKTAEITHRYIVLYKPKGYVTTRSDPEGRRTVMDLIGEGAYIYPVGRLDYDSEGLLLMMTDGDLAALLMHPRHEIDKVYEVIVHGRARSAGARKAAQGRLHRRRPDLAGRHPRRHHGQGRPPDDAADDHDS